VRSSEKWPAATYAAQLVAARRMDRQYPPRCGDTQPADVSRGGRAPDEVVADRSYSINSVYQLLRRDSILPSIPRRIPWRTTASGRKFELGFTYVPSVDRYRCPKGKWLYRLDVPYNGLIRYRTHRYACRQCELKPRCTRGEQCTISQPVDGGTRRWVDDHLRTWTARLSIRLRPCWVETVMTDLKATVGWEGLA